MEVVDGVTEAVGSGVWVTGREGEAGGSVCGMPPVLDEQPIIKAITNKDNKTKEIRWDNFVMQVISFFVISPDPMRLDAFNRADEVFYPVPLSNDLQV